MKQTRKFYHCPHCKNLTELLINGGGSMSCCDHPMVLLEAGAQDASLEKHVPYCQRQGNTLQVEIGSEPHPMTPEHHIAWIIVAQPGLTQRVDLDVNGPAKAEFTLLDGPVTVYEYCNLHGLWLAEA